MQRPRHARTSTLRSDNRQHHLRLTRGTSTCEFWLHSSTTTSRARPSTLHPPPSTLHPPPSSTAPLLPPDQGTPAHLVSVFLVLPPLRHTSAYERDCLWAPCISASFPSFSLSLLPFQLPFPTPTFPLPPPLPPLPPALRRRREGSRQPFLSPEVQFHFLDFRDEWTCKKQRKFFTFSWISTRQRSAGA